MASRSLPYREPPEPGDRILYPAHLLILLTASVGALVWGTFLITGDQATPFQTYMLVLGLYGMFSAAFIFFQIHRSRLNLFSIPVFITILVFIRFGLVPLYAFANPRNLDRNFLGSYDLLVKALLLVALSMTALWLGSACLGRPKRGESDLAHGPSRAQARPLHDSILAMAAGLYCGVILSKLYLLHAHLLRYTMSWRAYHSNLALLQVLGAIALLGSCVLIVFTIERYSHPSDSRRKILFFAVFISECGWGLISGDKRPLLLTFFLVAVVSSIIQRRIRKGWLLAPILGLVLFYPLSNAYRSLLRRNGGASSVVFATSLGSDAIRQAAENEGSVQGWVRSGWEAAVRRLDLLQSVGLVLALGPRVKLLKGQERWWMIPYYAFVPRFMWRSKPVLNEGARFSVALGYGDHTSTAVTYPGDLYASYGLPGILVGMFLLGIAGQWLSNAVAGAVDKRRLFLFASLFPAITNMELESFSFWTSLIKNFVILSAIALVVYGPRRQAAMAQVTRRSKAIARP